MKMELLAAKGKKLLTDFCHIRFNCTASRQKKYLNRITLCASSVFRGFTEYFYSFIYNTFNFKILGPGDNG